MKIELSNRGSGLRFTQSFFTARDLRSGFRELDPTGRFYLKPYLKIGRKEVSVVGYAIAIAPRRSKCRDGYLIELDHLQISQTTTVMIQHARMYQKQALPFIHRMRGLTAREYIAEQYSPKTNQKGSDSNLTVPWIRTRTCYGLVYIHVIDSFASGQVKVCSILGLNDSKFEQMACHLTRVLSSENGC